MSGVEKIPTQGEYKNAIEGDTDLIKNVKTRSSIGKVMFRSVKNAKSEDFLEGNCKVAWDRPVSKYALHTASSL